MGSIPVLFYPSRVSLICLQMKQYSTLLEVQLCHQEKPIAPRRGARDSHYYAHSPNPQNPGLIYRRYSVSLFPV